MQVDGKHVLAAVVLGFAWVSALHLDPNAILAPASWAVVSVCVHLAYVVLAGGWAALDLWGRRTFMWGVFSSVVFLNYLQLDAEFTGWGSVFFFCGSNLQYCTCNFRWNAFGWAKAAVLWNFVLSAALGLQRLAIQVGLGGLLPGEESVTKESFISIGWRLIPYWLNNWEKQWGAECSSMMFELPHVAIELLVVLPCVQVLCSRLKLLVTPQLNMLPPMWEGEFVREDFAPNLIKGFWERSPGQRKLLNRLRAHARVMLFVVMLSSLAAYNSLRMPLTLEASIAAHPHARPVQLAGLHANIWLGNQTLSTALSSARDANVSLQHAESRAVHDLLRSSVHWAAAQGLYGQEQGQASQAQGVTPAATHSTMDQGGAVSMISEAGQHAGISMDGSGQLAPAASGLSNLEGMLFGSSLLGQMNDHNVLRGVPPAAIRAAYKQAATAAGDSVPSALRALGPLAAIAASWTDEQSGNALLAVTLAAVNKTKQGKPVPLYMHASHASTAAGAQSRPGRVPVHASTAAGMLLDLLMGKQATAVIGNGKRSTIESAAAVDLLYRPLPVTVPGGPRAAVHLSRTLHAMRIQPGDVESLRLVDQRLFLYLGREEMGAKGCPRVQPLRANLRKHAAEITRVQDSSHRALIPLVEAALALMRLACEKFFVLLAIFVAYLLFRDPPRPARMVIRVVARLSALFQRVILYSFPAVCWLYGAGIAFSLFVSVVFWGAPLMALHEAIRSRATSVRVRCLSPATHEQIERMGGSCAICWGGMTATAGAGAAASSSAATAAAPAAERPAVLAATTGPERAAASAGAAVASRSTDAATARADGGATTASAPAVAKQLVPDRVRNGSLAVGLERTGSGVEAAADREAEHSGSEGSEMSDEGEGDNSEDSSEEGEESETGEGFALPCGHAYHAPCLAQWLHQCATQGQAPKCPMCSTVIELEVRWRLPLPWNVRGAADALGLDAAGHGGHGHMHAIGAHAAHHHARADVDLIEAAAQLAGANPALRVVGLLEHQRELQALLADMPMWVPPPGPAAQQGALALPLVIEAGAGAPNGAVGGNGGALLGAGERERERGDVDGGRAPRVRIGRQAAAAAVVAPLLRQAAPAAAAAEPAAGPARPVPAPHQQLQGGQQQQGVVAQLLQQVQQQQQVQAQQQQQVQQQLAATQERLAHMRQEHAVMAQEGAALGAQLQRVGARVQAVRRQADALLADLHQQQPLEQAGAGRSSSSKAGKAHGQEPHEHTPGTAPPESGLQASSMQPLASSSTFSASALASASSSKGLAGHESAGGGSNSQKHGCSLASASGQGPFAGLAVFAQSTPAASTSASAASGAAFISTEASASPSSTSKLGRQVSSAAAAAAAAAIARHASASSGISKMARPDVDSAAAITKQGGLPAGVETVELHRPGAPSSSGTQYTDVLSHGQGVSVSQADVCTDSTLSLACAAGQDVQVVEKTAPTADLEPAQGQAHAPDSSSAGQAVGVSANRRRFALFRGKHKPT